MDYITLYTHAGGTVEYAWGFALTDSVLYFAIYDGDDTIYPRSYPTNGTGDKFIVDEPANTIIVAQRESDAEQPYAPETRTTIVAQDIKDALNQLQYQIEENKEEYDVYGISFALGDPNAIDPTLRADRADKVVIFDSTGVNVTSGIDINDLENLYDDFITKYTQFVSDYADFNTDFATFGTNYADFSTKYDQFVIDYADLVAKYDDFITKYTQFVSDYADFAIDYTDFATKYDQFVIDYADFSTKYDDFITKYDDFIIKYDSILATLPPQVQKKNLISYALDNPTVINFWVTDDPYYPNGVIVFLDRTLDKWFINFDGNYFPLADIMLPFNEANVDNYGDDAYTTTYECLTERTVLDYAGNYVVLPPTDELVVPPMKGARYVTETITTDVDRGDYERAISVHQTLEDGTPLPNIVFDPDPQATNICLHQHSGNSPYTDDYLIANFDGISRIDFDTLRAEQQVTGVQGDVPYPNPFIVSSSDMSSGDIIYLRMKLKQYFQENNSQRFSFYVNGAVFTDADMELLEDGTSIATSTGTGILYIPYDSYQTSAELILKITLTSDVTVTGAVQILYYMLGITGNTMSAGNYIEWGECDLRINEPFDNYIPTWDGAETRGINLLYTDLQDNFTTATFLATTSFTDDLVQQSVLYGYASTNPLSSVLYVRANRDLGSKSMTIFMREYLGTGTTFYTFNIPIDLVDVEHIAITINGTDVELYVNGVYVDTFTFSTGLDEISNVYIGTNNAGTQVNTCCYGNFIAYPKILTDLEIQEHYIASTQLAQLTTTSGVALTT